MDKKILKNVLSTIKPGDSIDVTFRGTKTEFNGAYQVVSSKRGRGRAGSMDVVAMSTTHGNVELRTRNNEEILNIVYNGTTFGSSTETDEPRKFETDKERANELKELFKSFKEGQKVSITSTLMPEFNGAWFIRTNKPVPGKFGQRVLVLVNDEGKFVEAWSYRHSKVIETINASA